MIQFLIKGLMRDLHRSLFPVLIVAAGVSLTVFLDAWITGEMSAVVDTGVNMQRGHYRVMTAPYEALEEQAPIDLAILDADEVEEQLKEQFPHIQWRHRISFGGLMDIPRDDGGTLHQSSFVATAFNLHSQDELFRLRVQDALKSGSVPEQGEFLISHKLAQKLSLELGQTVTMISSTVDGTMALGNFKISGTIDFGIAALDRSGILLGLDDARMLLNMPGGSSIILGFLGDGPFQGEVADSLSASFNKKYADSQDPYHPVMRSLKDVKDLYQYLSLGEWIGAAVSAVFTFIMAVVLWNASLLGGIRRHGEFGLRLAIGESKGFLYRSLLAEAAMVGILGSLLGTFLGLIPAYYLKEHGFNIGDMLNADASMMITDVIYAQPSLRSYFIGFIPGVIANIMGAVIAGRSIFSMQTSQLFKELER